jgi:hypothetical protein
VPRRVLSWGNVRSQNSDRSHAASQAGGCTVQDGRLPSRANQLFRPKALLKGVDAADAILIVSTQPHSIAGCR